MSAGSKRKCPGSHGTSVLLSGADTVSLTQHVRLVPTTESAARMREDGAVTPEVRASRPLAMLSSLIRVIRRGATA